jgi:hypothetical protein
MEPIEVETVYSGTLLDVVVETWEKRERDRRAAALPA